MKTISKKIEATLLAVFLLMAIAAVTVMPTVCAHDPAWDIPTWTYIAATNNPIGVNQDLVIVYWTNAVPVTAQGNYGDRWTFHVDVTAPDGSEETLGPFISDPVGGAYALYTPTHTGAYTFVAKFDGKTIDGLPYDPRLPQERQYNAAYWGDTYLPSESNPLVITVQQQPIEAHVESPLPTEYWTRPVNLVNRDWYRLLGNWLSGAAQTNGPTTNFCYGMAPESAHVLWATPMWSGGYMDERFSDIGYQTGHYEGLQFSPPIIMDGRIYYNVNTYPKVGWYALSLYTGEVEYFHNTTGPVTGSGGGFNSAGSIAGDSLAFGQIYNYDSPNQHGGFPYLWSTSYYNATTDSIQPNTWVMFDGYTGNYICTLNNVPSWAGGGGFFGGGGTAVYGKDGSILRYYIANLGTPVAPDYYLQVWNTSKAIMAPSYTSTAANAYWMWRPTLNYTFNGDDGYSLNVSIPNVAGSSIRTIREGEFVIGGTTGKANATYTEQGQMWALSLKPGEEGKLLWNITFTPPMNIPDAAAGSGFGAAGVALSTVSPEAGVFLFNNRITLQWYGYSLETGEQLWGPTPPEGDMNFYGMYSQVYDGKLLSTGYSGELIAYDMQTGDIVWKYVAEQEGFESPYGNFPLYITAIADGKIFTVSGEHSPTQPMWRGSYIR
ncbi:MAG: PQQ-like beta-propeller repeat protein, partial [Candidatus Bathyarchaeota archaeon]|nr:PQQ-like beta-propeller repeat protein [Candidatus Bathyarchaeota archaeon]